MSLVMRVFEGAVLKKWAMLFVHKQLMSLKLMANCARN